MSEPAHIRLSARYGKFLFKHRTAFALAVGLLSAVALMGLVQLRFDGEPRKIFKQSDDAFAKLEEYFEHFGADDNHVLLILHSSSIFSPEFVENLRAALSH